MHIFFGTNEGKPTIKTEISENVRIFFDKTFVIVFKSSMIDFFSNLNSASLDSRGVVFQMKL